MKYFGQRITAQAEKVRNELIFENVETAPITTDKCEPDRYDMCIEGKVIVIRAEVLRREYQLPLGSFNFVQVVSVHRQTAAVVPVTASTFITVRNPALSAGMCWAN
jgi:hypothetical protein